MDFQRMTLVNIYGDIRNYLTGVDGFTEEFTISCVKAHLDFLILFLFNTPAPVELNVEENIEEEKPKKKRGRPKKSKENNVEVA